MVLSVLSAVVALTGILKNIQLISAVINVIDIVFFIVFPPLFNYFFNDNNFFSHNHFMFFP